MTHRRVEVPLTDALLEGDVAATVHQALGGPRGILGITVHPEQRVAIVDIDDEIYVTARVEEAMTKMARARSDPFRGHADHESHPPMRDASRQNRKRLLIVAVLGVFVMTIEIAGGLAANSLVLLADAAHYATDLLAVLLAYFAVSWAARAANTRKTFGYHRAEVVAAFVNAIGLWLISAFFIYEAVQRLRDPPPVSGTLVIAVGALTLAANLFLAWLLRRGSGQNINVRAAYLHIVSDVLGSAAALLAGVVIASAGWTWADPALTIFVTILILVFTWRLTRQTLHILLEGSPANIDLNDLAATMRAIPSVRDVHDLHIWSLTSGVDSVSAHVVLDEPPRDDRVSHDIHEQLRSRFKIDHVTVQVESPECPCTTTRHAFPGA